MSYTLLYNCRIFTGKTFIQNGAVLFKNDKIAHVFHGTGSEEEYANRIDLNGAWVTPGFIDTHIHGFNGCEALDATADALKNMSLNLARFGTTGFFATLSRLTNDKNELLCAVKTIADVIGHEQGARILGIHLEGPFLSHAKKGAQPTKGIIPIDIAYLTDLWHASNGTIKSITVAPELDNLEQLAAFCADNGIVMQAGHTNATYEQMQKAFDLGILHATHFYNGMSGLHHRTPGVVGAILDNDAASCEIIADGHHVHPAALRIVRRCKPEDKIIFVTDSLKMTKQNIKSAMVDGEEICLDGAFYKKQSGTLVGANISMADGVKNLVAFGFPLKSALMAATGNPAKLFNLKGYGFIQKGYFANLSVLDDNLNVKMCFVHGSKIQG